MTDTATDSTGRKPAGALFVVATPIGNLQDLSPRARRLSARRRPAARRGHAAHAHAARTPAASRVPPVRSSRCTSTTSASASPALVERLQAGATRRAGERRGHAADQRSRVAAGAPRGARGRRGRRACPGPARRSRRCRSPACRPSVSCSRDSCPPKPTARRAGARGAGARSAHARVLRGAASARGRRLQDLAHGVRRRSAQRPWRAKSPSVSRHVYRGTLAALAQQCATDANMTRGEIVLVVAGAPRAGGRAMRTRWRGAHADERCCRNCRCRRPRVSPRSSPAAAARNSTSARSRWRRRSHGEWRAGSVYCARESARQPLRLRRGGKSGLHRARCQVTPGGREPTESATESKPPMSRHCKRVWQVRVKGCGKSAPRRWQHSAARQTPPGARPNREARGPSGPFLLPAGASG